MNGPAAPTTDPSPEAGFVRTAGAALFLACAWTWVIGMWLPVVLLADFGWPAWIVFAIPNVVGAASVGFVFTTREASERFIERRLPTMRAFSHVTLGLHAFVLTWMLPIVLDAFLSAQAARYAGVGIVAMLWIGALLLSRLRFRAMCAVALGVWLLSALCIALAWRTGTSAGWPPGPRGSQPISGLVWLAPVIVFGFALCPHLDLTLHRARRETPGRAGTFAFALGFGALFLAMIVGTLLYASGIVNAGVLSHYIVAHLAAQSLFTMGVHFRELRLHPAPVLVEPRDQTGRPRGQSIMPLLVGVAAGLLPSSGIGQSVALGGWGGFETLYRGAMAFYGLLFPALLWMWAASRRDDPAATVLAVLTIGLAAPLFWLGFIEQTWPALGVGLLLPLGAPLVARFLLKTPDSAPSGQARNP